MQNEKTSRLTFATPSAEETQQIREGLLTYISKEAVNRLLEEKYLILGKGRRIEIFVVSAPLWKLYQQMQPQHPYFIGLFLGELKEVEFLPSLHILQYLSSDLKSSATVVVDTKGEQRFLYGRALEAHQFQSTIPNSEKPRKVVVLNSKGEGLGYGQVTKSKAGEQLKPQLDLGWYLRRGQ